MTVMSAQNPKAPSRRTQLSDIVAERKEAAGLSYERLAARCIDPESGEQTVKSSWLHRLATGKPVEAPGYEMLRGLAAGLGLPVGELQDAASAQFFGADKVFPESAEAQAFLEDADRLTPAQREVIRALMRSMNEGR
ncbi:helix-turn-helix domain-containing protein [Streptomyces canus]|uniref:helix-turn-helix domain-containing protein n=1 Tax=Streptomyces canus TaxID=58343 RepID=UPI0036E9A469